VAGIRRWGRRQARAGNATLPAHHSRYLAEYIADATYLEFPEADLLYFAGHADAVLDAIEEFVTGARPLPSPDRFLGTVLFVAGAPIRLESRGTHELKGVPGSWEVFAVVSWGPAR
jgi:hypothetical protein